MVEIKVPALGESVTEATVAKWMKKVGDAVAKDEPLCELETDKVTLEVNAPSAGTLSEIRAPEGSNVAIGQILGVIGEGAAAAKPAAAPAAKAAPAAAAAAPSAETAPLSPAVRKLVAENELRPAAIPGSGKDGRLTKGDVLAFMEKSSSARSGMTQRVPTGAPAAAAPQSAPAPEPAAPRTAGEREQRVRMTRLRKRIAERLKSAQNTAAMLTTFNEVDMSAILKLREQFRDSFEKKHGVRLGFMSFFVKACIQALKEIPAVNGE